MKKVKSNKTAKTAAKRSTAKKKVKSKLVAKSETSASQIHNTSGGEMPNPASRTRPTRKDVRFGFR